MKDITALVLTRNEAPNVTRTRGKLSWLSSVVVVDSESTDATTELAARFPNVRVVSRAFTTHAEQWNYGLEQTGILIECAGADADFVLSDALVQEIQSLETDAATAGCSASFDIASTAALRGAAYHPWWCVPPQSGRYLQDGYTRDQADGDVRPSPRRSSTMISRWPTGWRAVAPHGAEATSRPPRRRWGSTPAALDQMRRRRCFSTAMSFAAGCSTARRDCSTRCSARRRN